MPRLRSWSWMAGRLALLALVTLAAATDDDRDSGHSLSTTTAPAGKILSRHRRYVVFPEGSTFTAAFCMTVKTYMMKETSIYTQGIAWGISYDLPNNTRELASLGAGIGADNLRRKGRRDRRELYRKLEIAANANMLDGRACMLRAICEARDLPGEKEKSPRSLPLEIFRTILNVPIESLASHEPYEHHEYALARRLGIEGEDCEKHFPKCPLSIVSRITSWVPADIFEQLEG